MFIIIEITGGYLRVLNLNNYFTSDERKVIYFLSFIILLSAGVRYFIPRERFEEIEVEEEINIFPLDLNTANIDELVQVPGIGPATAKMIIEYREKIGKFKSIYELKNIKGIGDKKVEKWKEYLKVE